jgi:hypothetical protein
MSGLATPFIVCTQYYFRFSWSELGVHGWFADPLRVPASPTSISRIQGDIRHTLCGIIGVGEQPSRLAGGRLWKQGNSHGHCQHQTNVSQATSIDSAMVVAGLRFVVSDP